MQDTSKDAQKLKKLIQKPNNEIVIMSLTSRWAQWYIVFMDWRHSARRYETPKKGMLHDFLKLSEAITL